MKYQIKQYGDEDGLSPEQLVVAEILATPGRNGMTLEDIAALVGTSARSVSRWRRDPIVMEYIRRRSLENVTAVMPSVMENLVQKAAKGDSIKAIEVYARIAGLYQPEMVVRPGPPVEESNEEIEHDIERLKAELGLEDEQQ